MSYWDFSGDNGFAFLDTGQLVDGELALALRSLNPADPSRRFVPTYDFQMLVPAADASPSPAGAINLRAGTTRDLELYGGHFGYHVEAQFRGHHYAERSVRLLLPLARRHGLQTIWITCNPDNWASRRTCERLGGVLVEIVDLPPDNDMYLEGERQKCRYRIGPG
jgi:tagatose 1,6-diphosphate aldolase